MSSKILKFREINRDIFEAIRDGSKKIETRAATEKYRSIQAGDRVELICGADKFIKEVRSVELFKTIDELVKKYKPNLINPNTKSKEELAKMYYSFPDYKGKIKKFGIIALKLI